MAHRPNSLQYEYELYVDREIENYKESVPRRVILSLGDEAVSGMASQPQLALTELLLCAEVDRLIRQRLRVPSFNSWRRRRLRALQDFCRPERWGLRPDSPIARTAATTGPGHVLVAGADEEGPAVYFAANGCAVTAVEPTEDVIERVLDAAASVGISGRIRSIVSDLGSWSPDLPLNAVVCSPSAFAGLTTSERERTLGLLKDATTAGGVHVVETSAEGRRMMEVEDLRSLYNGWEITVEYGRRSVETFFAHKDVA
ncbi:MAG TPA: hypothetical protein VEI06_06425 [Gemmatimonadaceae bacterium]|nr:hypothetical protein [Gemmatimonadaceae bacterium]